MSALNVSFGDLPIFRGGILRLATRSTCFAVRHLMMLFSLTNWVRIVPNWSSRIFVNSQGIFLLRQNSFHVPEFLFERGKHLLRDLELHGAWMMLNRESILTQILDEILILLLVITLSHL